MEEQLKELQQIRSIMEKSGRFLSLSGLSGILAGCYAIIGGLVFAWMNDFSVFDTTGLYVDKLMLINGMWPPFLIALVVLVLSIGTGMLLSRNKAKRRGTGWWSRSALMLIINIAVPLASGGAVCFILGWHIHLFLIPGLALVFYGLALFAGSRYTYSNIKYLGIAEIILGLFALAFNSYGFIAWMLGFGLFHIIYGSVMYLRYERR